MIAEEDRDGWCHYQSKMQDSRNGGSKTHEEPQLLLRCCIGQIHLLYPALAMSPGPMIKGLYKRWAPPFMVAA
jgi:hypothetical protein